MPDRNPTQRDRQTGSLASFRQIYRQAGRPAGRQKDRQTDIQTYKQTNRKTDFEIFISTVLYFFVVQ
jgi:hypothetical protein